MNDPQQTPTHRTSIEIPTEVMVKIAWRAAQLGALVDYIHLTREEVTFSCQGTEAKIDIDVGTRVSYTLPTRETAEDFTRFLAHFGLVFQVDFYYDLRRTVSFVIYG